MDELLKLQQSFYCNIFKQGDDLSFISSNFPQERFDVYRQTIFENMKGALRITYSGIWKLLGEACANSVAYAYSKMDQNLPKTGCLDDFGGNFPKFLSTLEQLSELPYLRDYAHYEWLKHLAYMATDSKSISPEDLMSIPEDEIDHVTFHFCPSVYIFQSKYPLFDVHEIVQDNSAKEVTLQQKESYGIINRKENEIHTYWTEEGNWSFIKKLFEGAPLLESAEYAQTINHSFDLSSAIAFVLQAELADNIINEGGKNAH
jgi:hypothetical protein